MYTSFAPKQVILKEYKWNATPKHHPYFGYHEK